jgi:hypothetical protein
LLHFGVFRHYFAVQTVHPTQRDFVVQVEQFFGNPSVVQANGFEFLVFVVAHVVLALVQVLARGLQREVFD